MSNVVQLHNNAGPEQGRPVEGLVKELERLLEAARAGEIIGFAGAYQHKSAMVGYSYAGAVQAYGMLGGLECLRLRLGQMMIERD